MSEILGLIPDPPLFPSKLIIYTYIGGTFTCHGFPDSVILQKGFEISGHCLLLNVNKTGETERTSVGCPGAYWIDSASEFPGTASG